MGITSNKPRIIIISTLFSVLALAIIAILYLKPDSSPQTTPVIVDESSIRKAEDSSRNYSRTIFAKDLKDPRDILVTPGGTVLVSLPSQGKVVALPDRDADGEADRQLDVVSDLNSPHGLAFYGGKLFVASQNALNRYAWDEELARASLERRLLSLPPGGRHITRSLAFNRGGDLFLSLGSSCDVCLESHPWLASVIVTDENGNNPRLYARGLRNAVFLRINPQSNELWATEMGRDFLGDNLPPDEINIIKDGADYGWPYCYGDRIFDDKFAGKTPQYCVDTVPPIYNIQAHSAPLGLVFIDSPLFPESWQGDLLVAYHGSWNRSELAGYKIVRLVLDANRVISEEDFISFLDENRVAGRPVDLEFDLEGNLLISDDRQGVIYKVSGD